MGVNLTLQDQGSTAPRTGFTNVIALLAVASSGTANAPVQCSRDTIASATFGDGPLVECGGYVIRTGKCPAVLVRVTGSIAGSCSAVTQSGTGPAITVAGAAYDSLPGVHTKIAAAGDRGVGRFKVALDGSTYGPEILIPSPASAALQGTADLSGITLSTLNTKVFKIDEDTTTEQTVTFTTPSSVDDIAAQINTQTTNITASIVSGRYLKLLSDTTGTGSAITVGNGNANSILGFSTGATDTGEGAVYTIPHTNVTMTFASGTYVLDEVYTFTTTAPRFTTTDLATALTALRASGLDFEDVHLLYDPIDAADALVMAAALDSAVAGWESGTPRLFKSWFMGTRYSATAGSAASDETNDNATKTAFSSFNSQIGAMVHGDIYMPGTNLPGLFRRQLVWAHAGRAAAYRLSSDPGNREQPSLESCSMTGPDGTTKARDENTALVPMRTFRFTVAQDDAGAYISRGVTRATTAKFKHTGVLRMAMLAASTAFAGLKVYENADRRLNPDGTLLEEDAATIENALEERMLAALVDSPSSSQAHASAVQVTVDRTENVGATDNITATFAVQHKGQFVTVTGNVGIVSTLSLT